MKLADKCNADTNIWICEDRLIIDIGDERKERKENKTTYIPKEDPHRMQVKFPLQSFRQNTINFHNIWNEEEIQRVSKKEKHEFYWGFKRKLTSQYPTQLRDNGAMASNILRK